MENHQKYLRDKRVRELIGIDKATNKVYKEGKYWIGETNWTDEYNDKRYQLKTYKAINGRIVSTLNDELMREFDDTSAAKDVISTKHYAVRDAIFTALIKESINAE